MEPKSPEITPSPKPAEKKPAVSATKDSSQSSWLNRLKKRFAGRKVLEEIASGSSSPTTETPPADAQEKDPTTLHKEYETARTIGIALLDLKKADGTPVVTTPITHSLHPTLDSLLGSAKQVDNVSAEEAIEVQKATIQLVAEMTNSISRDSPTFISSLQGDLDTQMRQALGDGIAFCESNQEDVGSIAIAELAEAMLRQAEERVNSTKIVKPQVVEVSKQERQLREKLREEHIAREKAEWPLKVQDKVRSLTERINWIKTEKLPALHREQPQGHGLTPQVEPQNNISQFPPRSA